ncbi:MAG: iron ABC transporter permease [Mycoplasmoidaceae bacterium]
MIKQNKIKFISSNNPITKKKILIMFFLITTFMFIMALILSLGKNGFQDAEKIFIINKNLIFVIPIASASLSIASLLLQQLSKNKLADNSVLGLGNINLITLMALMFVVDFDSDYSVNNYMNIYPFLFIIFSMLSCFVIFLVSYKKNKNISKKFIIVGVIFNFTFLSVSSSLDIFLPAGKSASLQQFINGFIDSSHDLPIIVSFVGFLIGTIWLAFIFQKFKICTTSYSIAKSLGINANSINLQILLICGLLSGVAFTLVGNLTFLGLIAGNIASFLFKKNYAYSFPASCLIGSIIVGLAFLINKNIFESNINTPAIIPLVGIPYFIYLITKEK